MKILRGLAIGLVATQALDWLSIVLYEKEDEVTRELEDEARSGLHAYEVATDRMMRRLGVPLQRKDLKVWGWRFHKLFGILGGVGYEALRSRFPRVGSAMGLNFGAGFFFLVDEGLVPLFKLTPGPQAFSWKVHTRGAVSHLAYGVAAELTYRAWDRVQAQVVGRKPFQQLRSADASRLSAA